MARKKKVEKISYEIRYCSVCNHYFIYDIIKRTEKKIQYNEYRELKKTVLRFVKEYELTCSGCFTQSLR